MGCNTARTTSACRWNITAKLEGSHWGPLGSGLRCGQSAFALLEILPDVVPIVRSPPSPPASRFSLKFALLHCFGLCLQLKLLEPHLDAYATHLPIRATVRCRLNSIAIAAHILAEIRDSSPFGPSFPLAAASSVSPTSCGSKHGKTYIRPPSALRNADANDSRRRGNVGARGFLQVVWRRGRQRLLDRAKVRNGRASRVPQVDEGDASS
jgi:hypothetical protein